jgi:hypothetical protein
MSAPHSDPLRQAVACLALTLGAAACGSAAAEVEVFADACQQSTNLGEEICTCMGEKARDELPEDSRAFLLATLREDEAAVTETRGRLSLEEAMRAGMFMTNVTSCTPRTAPDESD